MTTNNDNERHDMTTATSTAPTRQRSEKRKQFLQDVLTTAIEGGINYWAGVDEYKWDGLPVGDAYAVVVEQEEITTDEDGFDVYPESAKHRVDIDVIAKGIGILLEKRKDERWKKHYWHQFVIANRTNSDEGDYDADIADQILQAGLFGEVVYG